MTGQLRSVYRRPSLSANSASPSDRSLSNLRNVGEGALGDSDSDSSEGGDEDRNGRDASSDEESNLQPLISPQAGAASSHLSPLSSVAGQQQDEDEGEREEEYSPSPRSTDTESSSSGSPVPRPKLSRRNSNRIKSRSRSSTVASLAAGLFQHPLVKQESHSSIRTVIAAESSFREEDNNKGLTQTIAGPLLHAKNKSQGMLSEFSFVPEERSEEAELPPFGHVSTLSDRRPDIVRADEIRFRQMGWDALRGWLEFFADEVTYIVFPLLF